MTRKNPLFDTHSELAVQRYKHGIRLVKPHLHGEKFSTQTVSQLFNLPLSAYFFDHQNRFIDGNSGALETAGAASFKDIRGKTSEKFIGKTLEHIKLQHNRAVIQSQSLKVFEVSGTRVDDKNINILSFKMPWYNNNDVIGLMGFSLKIDNASMQRFGHTFALLHATGLIDASSSPVHTSQHTLFSPREFAILKLLIRGKTAKAIGEKLHLSYRTIEHYIENMRSKIQCASKAELIDKFIDEFH